MIRITDQYFWNFIFTIFFVVLVILGAIILDGEAHITPSELTLFDVTLITLASWRLVRLFVSDAITKWFREQFWDARLVRKQIVLEKPKTGPRRTIADLLSCPWCFGAWAAALVTFFYLLTPFAFYPVLFMAVSVIASFLHIVANLVGWCAEKKKIEVEGR